MIDLSQSTGLLFQGNNEYVLVMDGKFFGPYTKSQLKEIHSMIKEVELKGGNQ